MSITPLPIPPSRNDPENFAQRGDDFLGALPQFAIEMEEVRLQGEEVLGAVPVVLGAANYQGEYDPGVTYQVGMSVSYLGVRYVAKTINTGITPVDGVNWLVIREIPSTTGNEGKTLKVVGGVPAWVFASANFQEFTSSGTWTKPEGCTAVYVEVLGAGGGGGGGSSAGVGGGGGGGGALNRGWFSATDVSATEIITVGLGGSGGAGRVGTTGNGANGTSGGNSSFGTRLVAYGGFYGGAGQSGSSTGGGGGGTAGAATGGSNVFNGGLPFCIWGTGSWPNYVREDAIGGGGGWGATTISNGGRAGNAEYGGAGGVGANSNSLSPSVYNNGGSSLYAGSGGGHGGCINGSNSAREGGKRGTYVNGGGGAIGTSGTTPTDGGNGLEIGDAGGGGGAKTTTGGVAGKGGNGNKGAGGGGGGASTSNAASTAGAGGNGGDGLVRVWAW